MMCFPLEKHNVSGIFVETGTERGGGVKRALEAGFTEVHSIELAHNLYLGNIGRFWGDPKVNLWYGDCMDVLPVLLKKLPSPVTFWLDAHVDNGYVQDPKEKCPIIQELEIIGSFKRSSDIILIDDRRKFDNGDGDWGAHISEKAIIAKLKEVNSSFQITYENGIEVNDIICARCPE